MTRKQTIYLVLCLMFCTFSNAQNKVPTTVLDQIATECQNVIVLMNTIKARQSRIDELKGQLDVIRQNWWQTCNDALSSPKCDKNDVRLSTIDELIRLTDSKFESELLEQLKKAREDAAIRELKPIDSYVSSSGHIHTTREHNTSRNENDPIKEKSSKSVLKQDEESNGKVKDEPKDEGLTPLTEEQQKEEKGIKKENKSTSAVSKDLKKKPEKKEEPEQPENKDQRDKTKIESKDQINRNKTIDLFNKNKKQN